MYSFWDGYVGPNSTNTKLSTLHLPPGLVKGCLNGPGVGPTSRNWVKRPNEFPLAQNVHLLTLECPWDGWKVASELPICLDAAVKRDYMTAMTVINEYLDSEITDGGILFLETSLYWCFSSDFEHLPNPKFSLFILTLCPFSPGRPGRPSKPRSPWKNKKEEKVTVVQSQWHDRFQNA